MIQTVRCRFFSGTRKKRHPSHRTWISPWIYNGLRCLAPPRQRGSSIPAGERPSKGVGAHRTALSTQSNSTSISPTHAVSLNTRSCPVGNRFVGGGFIVSRSRLDFCGQNSLSYENLSVMLLHTVFSVLLGVVSRPPEDLLPSLKACQSGWMVVSYEIRCQSGGS